ncbi:DNA (cytosine-5-)-methyltransferase [Pseudoalteromonas atlantica]|uniref:Cytosine-specific methyltransferase n=1 Tax=Pseudoalteromonas atlantica TaxID=288 RepID=A0ABQ0UJ49_PSEAF|nr:MULTISPECIES: DNA cytosine methyltransferase [unclassified Pseudoalteromonas]TMO03300.1 DNA (cytosine-5-)-methyltransferase [Pseudoalteromonas sp. S327]TMO18791.1 DNA (cytosine-5-)-methyltransferase [Pseudoalteromonas sp. S326]GEK78473.1 DNA (cytosine-5-)-methyltransferase [Pseudoalteromonas atlantica]
MPKFFEFFSGGGMARLGLGGEWKCQFANDICAKKVSTYIENFGDDEILKEDIYKLNASNLPGKADLIWGSFPCQDLSLAGNGAGLNGERSGTFKKLMSIIKDLKVEKRQPNIIVLENVVGAITSHGGKDFEAIIEALSSLGYYTGGVVVDGASFVPQSRPRLFVIATKTPKTRFLTLISKEPNPEWHPSNLIKAHSALPEKLQKKWVWWSMPTPPKRDKNLVDIVEENPTDVKELGTGEVKKLISMMSETNLEKLNQAKRENGLVVGGLYKRVRKQKNGEKLQRAEVRFDGTAGCLRTPTGGSSRQTLVLVDNGEVKARLLSRREAARLMGVPDNYKLPSKYNDAYHVFGDGLVVPAVSWIEKHLLKPIQEAS